MKTLSVYVHIPFCATRCKYCDFESMANAPAGAIGRHIDDTSEQIFSFAGDTSGYTVTTIYFGGGTPSHIMPTQIKQILDTIRARFSVAPDAEITIECNPCDLQKNWDKSVYKLFGFNRISIGVQSFHPRTLEILGRTHTVDMAKRAIKFAVRHFDNVGIDLIHSVPGGRLKLPRRCLRMVQHVSAYALTSDKYPPFDERKGLRQQSRIERTLRRCGIHKYEVSNFAAPGYRSRHNMVYWTGGEWLGFGQGAKSHFATPWSAADRVMLGLRLVDGVDESVLRDAIGDNFDAKVGRLVSGGLLVRRGGRVACTPRGMNLLNRVLVALDI